MQQLVPRTADHACNPRRGTATEKFKGRILIWWPIYPESFTMLNIPRQLSLGWGKQKCRTALLVFGIVNTTYDYCEQHIVTVAHCLQQLTTSAVWPQSCLVANSCVWHKSTEQKAVLIVKHIFNLKPEHLPTGVWGGDGRLAKEMNINEATESVVATS